MAVNVLSGIVVSEDGLILTCAHVLGPSMPGKAWVVFLGSGEVREAAVLSEGWRGVDAEDVAVLCVCGALPEGIQPLSPLRGRFFVRPHAKGHETGVRRATIKAHPATPRHTRPYGHDDRMRTNPTLERSLPLGSSQGLEGHAKVTFGILDHINGIQVI